MKVAIIFFSGTSNTEFIAKQFKAEFEDSGMECSLIDIRRKKKINDGYNYFVFAAPIHWSMFPKYFINWISENIYNGNNRQCIVVSTQAGDMAAGHQELINLLVNRGFEVLIQDFIKMQNNYYADGSKSLDTEMAGRLKEEAKIRVKGIVGKFINGEKDLKEVSAENFDKRKLAYTLFDEYTPDWAKNNLSIDYDLCVKCGKCSKNCPTRNIKLGDQITFKSDCISCQRCIHSCPVNAFLYKGKKLEQYKI